LFPSESGEESSHKPLAGVEDCDDSQVPMSDVAFTPQAFAGDFGEAEKLAGGDEEFFTGRRQAHCVRVATDEDNAGILFELAQLAAHGGLGQIEHSGGRRDAARSGDPHKTL
jgi:hypothetical protein